MNNMKITNLEIETTVTRGIQIINILPITNTRKEQDLSLEKDLTIRKTTIKTEILNLMTLRIPEAKLLLLSENMLRRPIIILLILIIKIIQIIQILIILTLIIIIIIIVDRLNNLGMLKSKLNLLILKSKRKVEKILLLILKKQKPSRMKIKVLNLSKDLVKINNNNSLLPSNSHPNNNNKFKINQLNKLNKNKSQLRQSRIKLLSKKPKNLNKLL